MRAMQRRIPHFSRPVYEGLPWIYIICGLAALLASYLLASHGLLSLGIGALGLSGVLAGAVVLLRRRDYRALRSQYADPDSLGGRDKRGGP
jgi:membrane associated rhomboid family serine protease